MTFLQILFAAFTALFTFALIRSEYKRPTSRLFWKALASLCFIAFCIASLPGKARLGGVLLAGLICSLFGDVFLAFYDNGEYADSRWFKWGLISFAGAQALYSVFFITSVGFLWYSIPVCVVIALISLGGIFTFKMDVKGMLGYLSVYSLLLCFAFANAVMTLFLAPSATSWFYAVGMASFLISDLVLMFKYFLPGAKKWLTVPNLIAYYAAQLLLVFGLIF